MEVSSTGAYTGDIFEINSKNNKTVEKYITLISRQIADYQLLNNETAK